MDLSAAEFGKRQESYQRGQIEAWLNVVYWEHRFSHKPLELQVSFAVLLLLHCYCLCIGDCYRALLLCMRSISTSESIGIRNQ